MLIVSWRKKMLILLTLFLAVGLNAGWINSLLDDSLGAQIMVLGCILVSLVFGLAAELLVGAARFDLSGGRPVRGLLRRIGTSWALAVCIGAVAVALLGSRAFDSIRVVPLLVSAVVLDLVVVCGIACVIEARARRAARRQSVSLRDFGNYALVNVTSMVVGVTAGRVYLYIVYPGAG
jgi:hypothetical protein